ncbi:MAG: hypothetical protein L7F77_15610 [Candidatus Magnetominusculus sp. LBB02]|nr:hypothetical protein [Candidatus Magnetominusculus sp. LBB02]
MRNNTAIGGKIIFAAILRQILNQIHSAAISGRFIAPLAQPARAIIDRGVKY